MASVVMAGLPLLDIAEAPTAFSNSHRGVDLGRCLLQKGLWEDGFSQSVLLDTSGCAPGLYTSTAVASESEDEGRSTEALLEVLGHLCQELGSEAHCILICERRRMHGLSFRQSVWSSGGPSPSDEAMKRVHIKYVMPPSALGDMPPLVELLVGLQNLTFKPAAVAILGLTSLTCAPSSNAAITMPGAPSNPAACYTRNAFIGAAAADARNFALCAALLVDAVEQVSADQKGHHGCRALLWDDAAPPEGSAQASAQLGLLGSAFDGVWSIGWKVHDGSSALYPFAEALGRSLPSGRL